MSRRQRIRELEERVQLLLEQRDSARADAATHLGAVRTLAARNVHLNDQLAGARAFASCAELADALFYERRIERLARAVVRLRSELAAQCRVADRLSDQLLGSLGYTDAALSLLGVVRETGGAA